MITVQNRSADKAMTFSRRTALLVGAATTTVAVGFVMGSGVSNAATAEKFITATKLQPNHFLSSAASANAVTYSNAATYAKAATYPIRWPTLTSGTYQPDDSTTGLLEGCTKEALAVRNGDWIVTVPNTAISNTLINGRLIIRAANVQVSNCWIQGPVAPTNANQALVDCTHSACVNFIIRDSVLAPQKPTLGWNSIAGHDYGAYRVNMYWCVDGGRVYNLNTGKRDALTNVVFSGCWIHDLTLFAPDPNHGDNRTHNDGIQIEGGAGTKIIGTRIDGFLATTWPGMVKATSDPTTNGPNVWAAPHVYSASGRCITAACIQVTPNVGAVTGLTLDRNYFNGGAVGVNAANGSPYAGLNGGKLGTFTGNRFDHKQGIQGGGGNKTFTIAYGAKYTLVQSGNVYLDNGAAVYVRANQTV